MDAAMDVLASPSGAVQQNEPQQPQSGSLLQGPGGKREQKLFTPAKLSFSQSDAVTRAKKYAMEQSIKSVLLKQTLIHQQQMAQYQNMQRPLTIMGSMQITEQVWTKLGTVYVGNINFDVREETVQQAFQPFGPVKNASLSWDAVANKHKGFAFVEYDVPEAATLALEQMNGVMLGGRNVRVGRPGNMPQAQAIIERLMEEAKPYNRIYIASIHADLKENDIQSVFEAFGPIRSCRLAPDMIRPGKHRGYGFIEYETPQAAIDAVASMNLFNLGGQYLRVGKAVTPPSVQQVPSFPTPMPTAAAVAAAAVTAKITAMDAVAGAPLIPVAGVGLAVAPALGTSPGRLPIAAPGIVIPQLATPLLAAPVGGGGRLSSAPIATNIPPPAVVAPPAVVLPGGLGGPGQQQLTEGQKRLVEEDVDHSIASQENMQISGTQARHSLMQKLMRPNDSRVMVLRNMVGAEDVDEDLESEVIDECSTYGSVNRVVIYQEKQSDADDAEVLVKIFVEFKQPSEMEKAVKVFDGRFFAGRRISAAPFEQSLFDANDLSG